MSIEGLKQAWDALPGETASEALSPTRIQNALRARYRRGIHRTMLLELGLLLVYGYFVGLSLFRFDHLEKPYLEILALGAVATLGYLILLQLIRLVGLFRFAYAEQSYVEVLEGLARQRIRHERFRLTKLVLSYLLLIVVAILQVKIYNEYDLVREPRFWWTLLPLSLAFLLLVRHRIRKYHQKAISAAERTLRELET
ncbi:MAG: hypothetical protein AAF146_25575 [Bacteroidota bacterium]